MAMTSVNAATAQSANWTVNPHEFASSMSLTSVVIFGGLESVDQEDEIGAFVNGQVRGAAKPVQVGQRSMFFLTVFGNSDGERVSFRYRRAEDGVTHDVFEGATFTADAIMGNTATPFFLTANVPTGIQSDESQVVQLANNFPNPFATTTTIGYVLTDYAQVTLDVFNIRGERVKQLVNARQSPGVYEVTMTADDLSNGVYYYQLRSSGVNESRTMVITR